MDTALNASLLNALVAIGLITAVWLAVSVPAYLLKTGLTRLRLYEAPKRMVGVARRFMRQRRGFRLLFGRVRRAWRDGHRRDSVEMSLELRHARLRALLDRTARAVREAVGQVLGLDGGKHLEDLASDVRALEDRCRAVERIGVEELDGNIEEQYRARGRSTIALVMSSVFVLAFSVANGLLLNMFFRDLVSARLFGVPASMILSILMVLVETAVGSYFAHLVKKKQRVLAGAAATAILGLIVFEAFVFGLISHEFELEVFADTPLLQWWMAPVGFVMALGNALGGYILHDALTERAEHSGAIRLRREIAAANAFVAALPHKWSAIDAKARTAESSIQRFVDALGGKAGALSGAVTTLASERDAILTALGQLRLDSPLVPAGPGDGQASSAKQVALFFFTILGFLAYVPAVAFVLSTGLAPVFENALLVAAALAVVVWLACYATGLLAFDRIQTLEHGRTQPIGPGALGYGVAGVLAASVLAGLIAAGASAFGFAGALLGLLLAGLGGLVAFAGYHAAAAAQGGLFTATVLAAFSLASGAVALALLMQALLWVGAAASWLIGAAVALAAAPMELLLSALRDRKPAFQTSSTIATDAEERAA